MTSAFGVPLAETTARHIGQGIILTLKEAVHERNIKKRG